MEEEEKYFETPEEVVWKKSRELNAKLQNLPEKLNISGYEVNL